jgi:hypothetical protein
MPRPQLNTASHSAGELTAVAVAPLLLGGTAATNILIQGDLGRGVAVAAASATMSLLFAATCRLLRRLLSPPQRE